MRIITEDNIEQIQSMNFSKNIEKLIGIESSNTDIKDFNMKGIIYDMRRQNANANKIKTPEKGQSGQFQIEEQLGNETPPYNPRTPSNYSPMFESPAYATGSPAYMPGQRTPSVYSPGEYNPNSPAYAPGSPQPTTPPYPPGSPQPTTPPYPPGSPAYNPGTPSDYSPIDSIHDPNSPEYAKDLVGGLKKMEGTRISIRGEEPNPDDYWLVTHTTPDFITVENQNQLSKSDTIRVLDRTQVIPYQEPQYYQAPQSFQQPLQVPYTNPYGVQQYEPTHGNINVNPIIKIVNGNDESSGTLDSGQGQGQPTSISPIVNEPVHIKEDNKKSIDEPNFNLPMIVVKKK